MTMGGIQPWHIILVVVVFLLLFGGKRLPDAARGLGRSLRILKSEVGAMHEEDGKTKTVETEATAAVPTAPSQITPAPIPQNPVQAPVVTPVVVAPASNGQPVQPVVPAPVTHVNVPVSGPPAN